MARVLVRTGDSLVVRQLHLLREQGSQLPQRAAHTLLVSRSDADLETQKLVLAPLMALGHHFKFGNDLIRRPALDQVGAQQAVELPLPHHVANGVRPVRDGLTLCYHGLRNKRNDRKGLWTAGENLRLPC